MVKFTKNLEHTQKLFALFDCFVVDPLQGVNPNNQTLPYINDFVYPKDSKFAEIILKFF